VQGWLDVIEVAELTAVMLPVAMVPGEALGSTISNCLSTAPTGESFVVENIELPTVIVLVLVLHVTVVVACCVLPLAPQSFTFTP
jgi:hypothetical protein